MLASEIIRRVREIQVRTGRHVADVLAGEYVSVFKGAGVEFDEVRPYVAGDDVRTIDWNVTARAGTPFVKRYVEERQLTLMLMADISASQDFGSVARTKREVTAELCALLAFSATRNDDKVGLVLFHGEVEAYVPPRKGQKHALRVVREVLAHPASPASSESAARPRTKRASIPLRTDHVPGAVGGISRWTHELGRWFRQMGANARSQLRHPRQATDIAGAIEFLLSVSKRRSVCFVVSDFIDEAFESALSMANRRHDVIAVLITDPRELHLDPVGLIGLRDAESGKTEIYDTGSPALRDALEAAAAARVGNLEAQLRRRGIDFIHVDASRDPIEPLVAFFRMRGRRSRR